MAELRGKWAVVTGASSGIGRDMALVLAGRGMNVALVARREDRLRELAHEIETGHKVYARVIPLDLGRLEAPVALCSRLKEEGIQPEVFINNAGFGIKGDFVAVPWERQEQMLNLNLVNLTHLTRLLLPEMLQRGSGYILQVSSIGAYQPTPTYATYAAAKSYVLNFGEAVNWELKGSGVSVSVLSPGGTLTEFMDVAGQKPGFMVRLVSMTSRRVAEIGINGMLRRQSNILPGWRNWLTAFTTRLVPRWLLMFMADWIMYDRDAPSARAGKQ